MDAEVVSSSIPKLGVNISCEFHFVISLLLAVENSIRNRNRVRRIIKAIHKYGRECPLSESTLEENLRLA